MEMLTLILGLSTAIWYLLDKLKLLWNKVSFHRYITIGVAALLGSAVVFNYNLDIIYALQLSNEITIMGQVLTALSIMSGSSAISEIIEKIKG